jgi:hypothetical protein
MRAVITGTDYIKDIDGSFKAIETNTNVGLSVDVVKYFDVESFNQFVIDNGFNEIVLLYNEINIQIFVSQIELEPYPVGESVVKQDLYSFLREYYKNTSITVTSQKLENTAITVPNIDDSETKLIIRLTYDTTALIDDIYTRDNWGFLKLMNDADPNSIAKTYINDTELGFDSIGTILRDNGNHPNYCVKKRITPANNNVYPKLFKVNTIDELNGLKTNLQVDEHIQEYILNTNDLLNNKLKIYRSVDMVYGDELDIMNLWVMEHTAIMDITQTPDFDDNNEVQIWDRVRYTTKYNSKTNDVALKLSADEDTKILNANNEIIEVQDLNVGDLVKSLSVPGMITGSNTRQTLQWVGDTNMIIADSFVTQSELVSKTETEYFGEIIELQLDNGSIFSDVPHAKIMKEDIISGSSVSVFRSYEDLVIGDTILVWDNQTDIIIKQTIVDVGYSFKKLKAYTLNIEEFDLFLTLEESVGNRYGLLTHNYDYDCKVYTCPLFYSLPGTQKYCGSGGDLPACLFSSICIRDYGLDVPCLYTYTCSSPVAYAFPGSFCNNQKL